MADWLIPTVAVIIVLAGSITAVVANMRQARIVAARKPGWVAYTVTDGTRNGTSGFREVQKRFGARPMSVLSALYVPRFNAVLAVGPQGAQLSFGAGRVFLKWDRPDVIDIGLLSPSGIPILTLRKADGDPALFGARFLHSAWRTMKRNEAVTAVQAMRDAAGFPPVSDDAIWVTVNDSERAGA